MSRARTTSDNYRQKPLSDAGCPHEVDLPPDLAVQSAAELAACTDVWRDGPAAALEIPGLRAEGE
ncbi:MAG: hypothetical protein M0Z94_14455, partial [Dehalococcoidales bacterium]|nr:hypothetical protein [Dehalococcoidales bacterium]